MPIIGRLLPFALLPLLVAPTVNSQAQEIAPATLRRPIPLPIESQPTNTLPPLRVHFAAIDCQPSPCCERSCRASLCGWYARAQSQVWSDYENFYCESNIFCDAAVLAGAATLAHTNADQSIRNWYQDDVRSSTTDDWAKIGKSFGELWILGVYGGAVVIGKTTECTAAGATTYEWGNRSVRGILVGAPVIAVLQRGLGSSRPWEERGSNWRPLEDDSGASGHAFLGAIPFLTAASMTKNRWLRGSLIVASTWTAWSRINDDEHYLSQVLLGWYVAYRAVQSVNCTEYEQRRMHILPFVHPEGTGLAVHLTY